MVAFKAEAPGAFGVGCAEEGEEVFVGVAAAGGVFFLDAEDIVEAHDGAGLDGALGGESGSDHGVGEVALGSGEFEEADAAAGAVVAFGYIFGGNEMEEEALFVFELEDGLGALIVIEGSEEGVGGGGQLILNGEAHEGGSDQSEAEGGQGDTKERVSHDESLSERKVAAFLLSSEEILRAEVGVGVDGGTGEADFVVDVRGGGATGAAAPGDEFAAGDPLAGDDIEAGEVAVVSFEAIAVIEHEKAAIAAIGVGEFDLAAGGGEHGGADGDRDIDAGVEGAEAAEGVEALAEEASEAALDGPEAGLGLEWDAGANGAGDLEGVTVAGGEIGVAEVVVILDGVVEGGGEAGFEAEGFVGFEFAFEAVGDADFGGEDLEGGQLLFAGVVFFFEAEVALADGIDFSAQGVVVADFPEHAGVGSSNTDETDSAKESKSQDPVQNAVGDMNSPQPAV